MRRRLKKKKKPDASVGVNGKDTALLHALHSPNDMSSLNRMSLRVLKNRSGDLGWCCCFVSQWHKGGVSADDNG